MNAISLKLRVILILLGCVTLTSLYTPSNSFAQDFASLTELRRELEQAKKEYNALAFDDAIARLERAIEFIEANQISDPVAAQIWIMLGVIKFNLSEALEDAKEPFIFGLYIDRQVKIPALYSTEQLDQYLDQLRDNLPSQKLRVRHEPILSARAGQQVSFKVNVPSSMPVYSVHVLIKRNGEDGYGEFELNPTSSTLFERALAGREVQSSFIQYYIEARDRGGVVLDRVASPDIPIQINISGYSSEKIGGPRAAPEAAPERVEPHTIAYLNLFLSSGAVTLFSDVYGTIYRDKFKTGNTSLSPLSISVEAGYTFSPYHRIGLQLRYLTTVGLQQNFTHLIPDKKLSNSFPVTEKQCFGLGIPGDCMINFRYHYSAILRDKFRLDILSQIGIGRYRSIVSNPRHSEQNPNTPEYKEHFGDQYHNCSASNKPTQPYIVPGTTNTVDVCKVSDTVRPGWFNLGTGIGLSYRVSPFIDLTSELGLFFILPNTSLAIDLSLGATYYF